jgi:hypothetical protein
MDEKKRLMLMFPLPKEAVKDHPTKKMADGTPFSSINPIYVTERLNKVLGLGGWSFETEMITSTPFTQKTRSGEREMFRGVVKCTLTLNESGAQYQTTASSDNNDEGDALKGAATDGLTKLASWLGVGSYIWKNQSYEQALADFNKQWEKLPKTE